MVCPGSDSAVIRIRGTNKALALTTDCNARYVFLDPYTGGQIAVAEAARNIVASGGTPLAITDCLNFGNPEKPEIFWQMERTIEGIKEACRTLNTPVVSGNVSLYNERIGVRRDDDEITAIYPTPTIGMVGLIEDLSHITTQDFKAAGDLIYVIGETAAEFGGSEIQKSQRKKISGRPPSINIAAEKAHQGAVLAAIKAGMLRSAHDVSEGGLAIAIAECLMTAADGLGAEINPYMDSPSLFSESQSRFILSVSPDKQAEFEKLMKTRRIKSTYIGQVTSKGELIITPVINISVAVCRRYWKGAIPHHAC